MKIYREVFKLMAEVEGICREMERKYNSDRILICPHYHCVKKSQLMISIYADTDTKNTVRYEDDELKIEVENGLDYQEIISELVSRLTK